MRGQKDYDNAKIYKLTSTVDDNYYIGSTCCPLTVRLHRHKSDSKSKPDRKVYKWMNDVGIDNIKIILIHNDFVCNNMDELRREEDSYIQMYKDDINCMNSNRAYTTLEERKDYLKKRYENNREVIKEQHKQYREQNREVIKEKQRQYYEKNKEAINEKHKQYREQNKEYGKEYYEKNKEALKEQHRRYKEQNREKGKEKITCDICNCQVRKYELSRHNRTNKHQTKLKASTI